MKYKVGDKVRIKNIDWYERNKNNINEVKCGTTVFIPAMTKHCGYIRTISKVFNIEKYYYIAEDDNLYCWTDEMIEGLVEEESANYSKVIDNGVSNPIIAKTSSATIDTDKGFYSYSDSDDNLEMEWNLPEGYQFVAENGNVINTKKIVLEKKKKEYPKTYEECLKILGFTTVYTPKVEPMFDYDDDIIALQKLKNCRDAYWKLYGEEMGLGKPWENGRYEIVYSICRDYDNIVKQDDYWGGAHIFEFPIREMRDAFYENFKEEIEICKELL